MPVARVGEIQIQYDLGGSGPRLLYISGTGGDLRLRPGVFEGPLPRRFEVLAFDQRGMGRSSKPDVRYTMADYADDAAGLLDALGWDDALVIGVSFGGMVAQELVLRHPRKVRKLALACTSPGGAGGSSFAFHNVQDLTGEARARHMIPITDTRHDAAWATAHPDEFLQMLAFAAQAPFSNEPGHAEGARRQLEARGEHDAWDRLDQIRCPALIAAGRYDGIALPQTQRNLQSRIRGAELGFFEGGHLFMMQDPEALPGIMAFLER